MSLLSRHGTLIFSTNFRRFKLAPQLTDEFEVVDITSRTIPQDFSRNSRIHSCFQISRLELEDGPKRPQGQAEGRDRERPDDRRG
jgi:23S rRNA (guanine2445-N2)-methyltransferase / 23S rRNA (guanine2069-N7)-methyltransferase